MNKKNLKKGKYGGKTLVEWGRELNISKQAAHKFIMKHGLDSYAYRVKIGDKYIKPKLTLAMLKQRSPFTRYQDLS